MERLTVRNRMGVAVLRIPCRCDHCGEVIYRLADQGNGEPIEKLAQYEDLEEQGKLLKLPCAVGDTVYRIHKKTELSPDRIYECRVVGIKQEYNNLVIKLHANINEETYSIWVNDWFARCQIGYEFFLTQEEAEAALKAMSEG